MTEPDPAIAPTSSSAELPAGIVPRRGFVGLWIAGAFVVAGALVAGGLFWSQKRATHRLEERWSALSRCLVGDGAVEAERAPLAAHDALVATAYEDPPSWPLRCALHAAALREEIAKQGHTRGPEGALGEHLLTSGDALFGARAAGAEGPKSAGEVPRRVGDLFKKAAATGWTTVPSDANAPPPPLSALVTREKLRATAPLAKDGARLSKIEAELNWLPDLAFLVPEPAHETALVCTVSASSAGVACKAVSPELLRHGGPLHLTASRAPGAAPLVVNGRHGSQGIRRVDGTPVLDDDKFGWASVDGDGTVTTLSYRNEYERGGTSKMRLARLAGAERASELFLPPKRVAKDNVYYAAFLGRGWVGWHGLDDQDRVVLMAQDVVPGAARLGPVVSIGEVGLRNDSETTWQTCESGGTLGLLFTTQRGPRIALRRSGSWSLVPEDAEAPAWGPITCRDGGVAALEASDTSLVQVACEAGGCKRTAAKLPQVVRRAAADLGAKIAVVEEMPGNAGLFLRVAAAADLASTPPVLLVDPLRDGDKLLPKPWLDEFRLFSMGGAALLIVSTDDGVRALRITPDGAIRPLDVARP